MKLPARALYAITSEALCRSPERLVEAVSAALRGGAQLIQYRDKWNTPALKLELAQGLQDCCRRHGAFFLVNDDIALAARVEADGVHLGRADATLQQARATLGPAAIIGVTCHNDVGLAQRLEKAGASYVAFGRFFPSRTKPDAPPADLSVLSAARQCIGIPVCAIGGITPENTPRVFAAGAHWVAAVEGLFGTADIEGAAQAYLQIP